MIWSWRNGKLMCGPPPVVSLYDSASMYADGPFEMCRTFNRSTFQLGAHVNRLMESCSALSIVLDLGAQEIADGHEMLIAKLEAEYPDVEEWRTVIQVGRGLLPLYQQISDSGEDAMLTPREPWIWIAGYPLRWVLRGKSNLYDGVDAVISDVQAIPDACFPQTIKHHNRIHFRLAEQRAGDAWPILMDEHGYLAEAPGANIALGYIDGLVRTPAANCLRGISMRVAAGIWQTLEGTDNFEWGSVDSCEITECSEAFFTCTPFSILPIRSIDGRKLECPGPITRRLTEAWVESVACDFVAQAKRWDAEA